MDQHIHLSQLATHHLEMREGEGGGMKGEGREEGGEGRGEGEGGGEGTECGR